MVERSQLLESLTAEERIALIGRLWDSLDPAAAAPLTPSLAAELDVAMKRIVEAPEHSPVVRGRLRRVLLHRARYAVYYKPYPSGTSVVGVNHGHRHPATWLRRAGPSLRLVPRTCSPTKPFVTRLRPLR